MSFEFEFERFLNVHPFLYYCNTTVQKINFREASRYEAQARTSSASQHPQPVVHPQRHSLVGEGKGSRLGGPVAEDNAGELDLAS